MSSTSFEDENRITPLKTRFMAAHQQMLRTDHETSDELNQNLVNEFLSRFRSHEKP